MGRPGGPAGRRLRSRPHARFDENPASPSLVQRRPGRTAYFERRSKGHREAAPSGTIHSLVRRLLASLASCALLLLVLAPAAFAYNDGRGFYGATNDKVVTIAGFILIVFFPTFVLLASLLQRRLEKRKDARVAAERSHAGDPRWRGGW